jgi:hypothetical protein
MEINLDKKRLLENLGTSVKSAFVLLLFLLSFQLLVEGWVAWGINFGSGLLEILQILLPYAVYINLFWIIVSIIIIGISEFSKKNY